VSQWESDFEIELEWDFEIELEWDFGIELEAVCNGMGYDYRPDSYIQSLHSARYTIRQQQASLVQVVDARTLS
jgi:hypothetical protein